MDEFFKELIERAHYYEQFDIVAEDIDIRTSFRKNGETRTEETIIEC